MNELSEDESCKCAQCGRDYMQKHSFFSTLCQECHLKSRNPNYALVLKVDLKRMILELRHSRYGFDQEEWFTNIEKQIGYDYKEDLTRILEERNYIKENWGKKRGVVKR